MGWGEINYLSIKANQTDFKHAHTKRLSGPSPAYKFSTSFKSDQEPSVGCGEGLGSGLCSAHRGPCATKRFLHAASRFWNA